MGQAGRYDVPASTTHFPDGAVILVTMIYCLVSTPLSALQPWLRAHAIYSANVGWPPNGTAICAPSPLPKIA